MYRYIRRSIKAAGVHIYGQGYKYLETRNYTKLTMSWQFNISKSSSIIT